MTSRVAFTCLVLAMCAVAIAASAPTENSPMGDPQSTAAELSNSGEEPVVNLDADKTEVAPKHDAVGEGQFGGGGFGGALLTTGSFTMMAASVGFEEEEELGEGDKGVHSLEATDFKQTLKDSTQSG